MDFDSLEAPPPRDDVAALVATDPAPEFGTRVSLAKHRRELLRELANLRVERKVPLQEVAEALGVSPTTLARLESGNGNPRLSRLLGYAEAIGVRITISMAPPTSQK